VDVSPRRASAGFDAPSAASPPPDARRPGLERLGGILLVALFAVLALAGPVKVLLDDEDEQAAGEVGMAGLRFSPDSLAVAVGTEVVFRNDDVAPHTVTATDGSVDSGVLSPGDSFSLVINEPLDYVCAIHPSMRAKVLLEG
jgi:plastocyanin